MPYEKDSTHESRRSGKGREEACGETFGRPCGLDGDVGILPHVDSADAGLEPPCDLLLGLCCGTGAVQGQWWPRRVSLHVYA